MDYSEEQEFQIADSTDRDYIIIARIDFHVESNYGADADGNRGVSRTYIEHAEILEIYPEDHQDWDLLPRLKKLFPNTIYNLSNYCLEYAE